MTTETHNPYVLSIMADCASPGHIREHGGDDSPGAAFLRSVQDAAIEAREYGDDLDDMRHELADGAVPVYTYDLWLTFTDLAAWNADTDDYGPAEDMTSGAQVALYVIAETLLAALFAEFEDDDDDETRDVADDAGVTA